MPTVQKRRAKPLIGLQKCIGYYFNDIGLLATALTHKSFANEATRTRIGDNAQLEFLGDAVLGLVVTQHLVMRYPELPVGRLAKMRAYLVSTAVLAEVARKIELGEYLLLGRGEEKNSGRKKDSLLADTLEALIAAIYLDGGLAKAKGVVLRQFAEFFEAARNNDYLENYKGYLQELAQGSLKVSPAYQVVAEWGPKHKRQFEVSIRISDELEARGIGRSKKEAEQGAARCLIERLKLLERETLEIIKNRK